MINIVKIKTGKTNIRFEETIYIIDEYKFIKKITVEYKGYEILIKIRGDEHNPPHIHIFYNNSDFFFDLDKQEMKKSETGKEDYIKLKNNKVLYTALLEYLKVRKDFLTESYIFKTLHY